ncbi:MAG: ADP-ribosylglycohydrolase family protein [Acidimicrobiia bacterium]|nr:ADP-ribosylglycohydrolase family protein [Acidimicrobiia bacterium]
MTADSSPVADPRRPRFSLSVDDGAGALLGAVAGDVAGGAHPSSYSAITQASTVLAYHLLTNLGVDRDDYARGLVELAGGEHGQFTYRAPSEAFGEWLKSSRSGTPVVSALPSSEPAARSVPIGVFHRREPEKLVTSAVNAARVTHLDAGSAVAAAAVAGAVAGSCFVQAGADLVLGAAETAEAAVDVIEDEPYRFGDVGAARAIPSHLRELARAAGDEPEQVVESVRTRLGALDGLGRALVGIVLGANKPVEAIRLIEIAGNVGGSESGAICGGIVGARSGLVRWPWRVHNDTWFAEIGRRLVTRHDEIRDLPIPYAVEERMLMAARTRASEETI